MRSLIRALPAFLALLLPRGLSGQAPVPANLAEVETARSRACVQPLADLAALDAALEPYARRVDRLNALGRAIALERAQDAAPFDAGDSTEAAVARWFVADSSLAAQYLAQADSALLVRRDSARNAILDRLREEIQRLSGEADAKLNEGAPAREAASLCVGVILVRSAVLEECGERSNPVCDAARSQDPQGPFRFVEAATDLWDVEEFGPWTKPEPIQISPTGNLTGASTSAHARLGNVAFQLALRPLLSRRSELSEEEIAQYEANLDSLGYTFDHPDFVMAPGFDLQGTLPPPLGGTTHYLLHFGDLSGDDVIWSTEAKEGGPLRAVFPARARDLTRLQAGEMVSLTAVRAPEEEGAAAEAVFTLSLLQVGQATNVGTLLQYFSEGGLNQDLRALIPPGSGG